MRPAESESCASILRGPQQGGLYHVFSVVFVSFTLDMARIHVLLPWYTMKLGCFLQARLNHCCLRRNSLKVEKCVTTVESSNKNAIGNISTTVISGGVTYDVYRPTETTLEKATTIVVHALGGFRFCMPSRFYAHAIGSLVCDGSTILWPP